jgi:hypothetical protein
VRVCSCVRERGEGKEERKEGTTRTEGFRGNSSAWSANLHGPLGVDSKIVNLMKLYIPERLHKRSTVLVRRGRFLLRFLRFSLRLVRSAHCLQTASLEQPRLHTLPQVGERHLRRNNGEQDTTGRLKVTSSNPGSSRIRMNPKILSAPMAIRYLLFTNVTVENLDSTSAEAGTSFNRFIPNAPHGWRRRLHPLCNVA